MLALKTPNLNMDKILHISIFFLTYFADISAQSWKKTKKQSIDYCFLELRPYNQANHVTL